MNASNSHLFNDELSPLNEGRFGALDSDRGVRHTGTPNYYDGTARLRELSLAVLFTAEQYDDSTPAQNAWYQSFVPGARLEIIEDAAHLVMPDNPRRYAEVVRRFLRDVERSK